MFKKNAGVVVSVLITMLMGACAQADQVTEIKKIIAPKLGDNIKIDAVKKTPYAGLYEVQLGDTIVYTDDKANYLFIGNIMDLNSRKNITRERVEKLTSIRVKDMPLDLALKQVNGKGERVMVTFEDPNCGYCKKLRHELQKLENVTIYTFMYDILSEDSSVKSKNVWCSANPLASWNDLMLNGKAPPPAPSTCMNNPHDKIRELGSKLHLTVTPVIFFADGSRLAGYVNVATLEEKLASVK